MRAKELLDDLKHVDVNNETLTKQAKRIPTDFFLIGALASIGLSVGLKLAGRDRDAHFVGHWPATLVGLGLLRKLMEHDEHTHEA